MQNLILLYDNAADAGAFVAGYGSWLAAQPLTNMQDPRPTKRAMSTDLNPSNTRFRITLNEDRTFKAIAFGPTNLKSGDQYKLSWFSDAAFTTLIATTGLVTFGPPAVPSLDLEWEDQNFWLGAGQFEDPDNAGLWVIHVFASETLATKYWQFEIFSPTNSDGNVSIGRNFMGLAYQPMYNFEPGSNRFGAAANTTSVKASGGTRYYNRRQRERTLDVVWPVLPSDEVITDVYRITAICDLDKQVFVIPDPEEIEHMSKISFLGNLAELPSFSLSNLDIASAGFRITEAL